RKELLKTALPYYEDFVKQKSYDPALRSRQAAAYSQLALVHYEMGDFEQALRAHKQAGDILAQLAKEFPDIVGYRQELARCHYNHAAMHVPLGRHGEALAVSAQSNLILEALIAEFPSEIDYRVQLARSHNLRGSVFRLTNRHVEAEHSFSQVVELGEKLV